MSIPVSSTEPSKDAPFFIANAVVSAVALSVLAYLLLIHRGHASGASALDALPAVNAGLNTLSAVLLTAGFVAIRRRAWRLHRNLMISAFAASGLFLCSYLAYHALHGETKYRGVGALRAVYLAILASHVLLSAAVVPLALTAFYFAAIRQFQRHRAVTRYLLPIWLYVSVTGVVVFLFLRGSYAR